jgi:hypothetical protein
MNHFAINTAFPIPASCFKQIPLTPREVDWADLAVATIKKHRSLSDGAPFYQTQ